MIKRWIPVGLFGLAIGAATPSSAQFDTRKPDGVAYPWTSDQLVMLPDRQRIRVQISLPPEGTIRPDGGFPVIYYTGNLSPRLMTDAMRRMGDEDDHAILIRVGAVSPDGGDAGSVPARLIRERVRPQLMRRFPEGVGREHFLTLGSRQDIEHIAADVGGDAFDTYLVAHIDCPTATRSTGRGGARIAADLVTISRSDCPSIDLATDAARWRRAAHIRLTDQDPVTMVPEVMIVATMFALADTFEAGVER